MKKTVPSDLSFLQRHVVRDLKDAQITTLNEEPEWLQAIPTSVLSHIREIVKKLRQLTPPSGNTDHLAKIIYLPFDNNGNPTRTKSYTAVQHECGIMPSVQFIQYSSNSQATNAEVQIKTSRNINTLGTVTISSNASIKGVVIFTGINT